MSGHLGHPWSCGFLHPFSYRLIEAALPCRLIEAALPYRIIEAALPYRLIEAALPCRLIEAALPCRHTHPRPFGARRPAIRDSCPKQLQAFDVAYHLRSLLFKKPCQIKTFTHPTNMSPSGNHIRRHHEKYC